MGKHHIKSHFQYRLKQRYGLKINFGEITDLSNLVKTGNSTEIKKGYTKTRTINLVPYKNRLIAVVYDWVQNIVITCLCPEWVIKQN